MAAEPVPFALIPQELEAAHIGVVPTLEDRFTELLLPVKLLEYVHMGLPVVASRLPGISDRFSEEDLLPFTPGDPLDLARALEAVLADPRAAARRATSATGRLADITWERQRERYLALVDELVGRDRSARCYAPLRLPRPEPPPRQAAAAWTETRGAPRMRSLAPEPPGPPARPFRGPTRR